MNQLQNHKSKKKKKKGPPYIHLPKMYILSYNRRKELNLTTLPNSHSK